MYMKYHNVEYRKNYLKQIVSVVENLVEFDDSTAITFNTPEEAEAYEAGYNAERAQQLRQASQEAYQRGVAEFKQLFMEAQKND